MAGFLKREQVLGLVAPAIGAGLAGLAATGSGQPDHATALAAALGAVAGGLALKWLQGGGTALGPSIPRSIPRSGARPGAAPSAPAARAAALAGSPSLAGPPSPGLLDAMPHGVLLIDAAGRVTFVNAHARRFFATLPPTPFAAATLRVPKLLAAIEAALDPEVAARPDEPVAFTLSRAAEIDLAAHIALLAPAVGTGDPPLRLLVTLEDQTRTHRAEQLHRDFVANASHELKTPLAAVSGLIETLTGHAKGDAEAQARFLGMMAAQTERMRHLIEDLISLNRIEINERIHPEAPQPVTRIVHEAVESLRPLAEAAGMRIVAMPPADLPTVPGSREELTQVFVNLVENALRYGQPSPEVRVRLIEGDPDRPGLLGISVEDDGPGIAREHLPRLTERFYRVSASRSRERGGTGLGLAIVKHILNRHRGNLAVESTPGKGSRFTAWLPVAEASGAAEAGGRPHLRLVSGN